MLRDYRKAGKNTMKNTERGREIEGENRLRNCASESPLWVFVFITRFLVLSLRNGLMSVYRA